MNCNRLLSKPFIIAWACVSATVGCGGSQTEGRTATDEVTATGTPARGSDRSRCDFRGRADREAVEAAGPGAVQPNVRRVYQLVGTGDSMHKVLVCREADTNLDGFKDLVRFYNEKGESLREEVDTNFDGKIDTTVGFAGGRISKEEIDTNFDGKIDLWKYYVGGRLSRIQRDVNFDGKPDRWEFYANGRLDRVGIDLDFDGHVDRWDRDQAMKLAEEAGEATPTQGAKTSSPPAGSAAAQGSAPVTTADSHPSH